MCVCARSCLVNDDAWLNRFVLNCLPECSELNLQTDKGFAITVYLFSSQLVYQCSAAMCYQAEDPAVPPHWTQLLKASTYRVTVRLAREATGEEM